MIVLRKKECLHCLVLQCGTVKHLLLFWMSFFTRFLDMDGKSVDLLDLIWCPCSWGIRNVSAGIAGSNPSTL